MRFVNRVACVVFGILVSVGGLLFAQTIEQNFGSTATLPINLASSAQTTGTLPVSRGGTNLTAASDDNIMVGNGTTWQSKAVSTCTDTGGNHLNYDASTNTISCGTSSNATPGGSTGQVQYNNTTFGGDPDFVWDATNNILSFGNNTTNPVIQGLASTSTPITLRGGTSTGSNTGGATTISSGAGSGTFLAGAITVQPGAAGGAGGVSGATLTLRAGTGGSTSGGGAVVTLAGGNGGSPNGNAGQVSILGGTGQGSGSAGGVDISGGSPGSTGLPGPITITASDAGSSATAAGGVVSISSGAGVGTNQDGGAMTLKVGAATGSGASNFIVQTNGANTRLSIDKNGVWQTPASTTSGTIFFGRGTTTAPAFQALNGGTVSPLKAQRVTTGSITAGASATVTITWTAAFADTNYTVNCSVQDSTTAAASLRVVHVETVGTTTTVARVENTSAGSLTGTLHCIAVHD